MSNQNLFSFSPVLTRVMTFFFRMLYHPFAWSYDLVSALVSLGRWNHWVRSVTGLLQGPQVLELGFGPGHLQAHLRDLGWQVMGVDESPQMAHQAAGRLRRMKQVPRLARGLAQELPFAAQSFDCVVATFPAPYIIEAQTLEEVQRVLRPGGRLVVLMIAWMTGTSPIERLLQAVYRITSEVPPEDWDPTSALEPFQKAGFEARLLFTEPPQSRLLFLIAEKL